MSEESFSKSFTGKRELCFDENEFLKDSFSVDNFLREHRHKANLEVMRDDLGTHLKTLRLAMIELINKDYEDFVNLSKDLVGLDNEIKKIQIPLEHIRNDVLSVKNDLDETISGFNSCLEHHKEITSKKKSLIHVTQVMTSIEKLNSILTLKDFSLELIERAAMEFNQLQFSLSKCEKDLQGSQRKMAEDLEHKLMDIINSKFLDCLREKNSSDLVKCLRIYEGLDRVRELELLVQQRVVAPRLNEIVKESVVQREPDGVGFVYEEVIHFIESELMVLLELTTWKESAPVVKGYHFLVESVWPELEKRLDLPLMFAPGNPAVFHSRFTKSVELMRKVEKLCGNKAAVLKLRSHPQYRRFFQKWNLPVYFKIRFQEIAGQLEKVLDEETTGKLNRTQDGGGYDLTSTSAAMEQLRKCWRNDVFLPELSHLFWKLSLQILSRYTVWIREFLVKEDEAQERQKADSSQTNSRSNSVHLRSRLNFLVCLYNDTTKLLSESESFLQDCQNKIPNRHLLQQELSASLQDSVKLVQDTLPKITESLVKVIVSDSSVHIRQISQIPRLFRRTNRKSSAEPCEYVGQILSLPRQFYEWNASSVKAEVLETWLTAIFNELTSLFCSAVKEVLTNAQKTEESLRRLKKKKENYSSKDSGDEEIRQQLVIDVHSFSDGANGIKVKKENVKMLQELVELVEMARDRPEKQ